LKKRFTKELVLAVDKIRMEVDALDYAMGVVLSMKYEDKR